MHTYLPLLAIMLHALAGAPALAADPVLIELFTSEGCSSCPPADQLLSRLRKNLLGPETPVITLGFHVTYWDYLGWKDPYGQRQFDLRQKEYARGSDRVYTPQAVVDGGAGLVGSDQPKLVSEIQKAGKVQKAKILVNPIRGDGFKNGLSLKISDLPKNSDEPLVLSIAWVENGVSTQVKEGENSGRELAHDGVVRSLSQLRGGRRKQFEGLELSAGAPDSQLNWARTEAIVILQELTTRKVIGVASWKP